MKSDTISSVACSLFAAKLIDDAALFSQLFSPEELKVVFDASFAKSTGKGTDRLNGFQFAIRSSAELTIASNKCLNAQYRFSPFMETLKTKGRDKLPRLIGIPTIRDRVVLHQLNKFFAAVYPDRVPRNVASTYVRSIAADLRSKASDNVWACGTDIKTFYDSIQQNRLSRVLRKRIKFWPALRLIEHALVTPTVPKNTQRSRHAEYRLDKGVPQGLAISNILASIYMHDVDKPMLNLPVSYYRYVDDVLIFGSEDAVQMALATFRSRLKYRGLSLHSVSSGKTQVAPLSDPFGYLGYTFKWPTITVRDTTVERFLQSIAAKFSDYTHNKSRRLEKFKYLNDERIANIFLLELNERLTGAISGKKRYGWIAYFNQITDLSLLHRLDKTIAGMFSRISDFGGAAPSGLRKLARAYFEMKFNPGAAAKADALYRNAELLNRHQRKVAQVLAASDELGESTVTVLREEYEAIKDSCPYNHEPVDHRLFLAQQRLSIEYLDGDHKPTMSWLAAAWAKLMDLLSSAKGFLIVWAVILLLLAMTPWSR